MSQNGGMTILENSVSYNLKVFSWVNPGPDTNIIYGRNVALSVVYKNGFQPFYVHKFHEIGGNFP